MRFDERCALEFMAMADRENVQTGLLSWILGRHSPFDTDRRASVLAALSGRPLPPIVSTATRTEDGDIDLVVTCHLADGGNAIVALENKLKSEESAEQLRRYDERLRGRPVHAKVLLTLLGETPRGGTGWVSASYAQLLNVLDSTAPPAGHAEDPYVRDARAMLRRFVGAVDLVVSEPRFARYAFRRGPQSPPPDEKPFADYVTTLRLTRLLQRAWCRRVGLTIGHLPPGWSVRTTTGSRSAAALLDVARLIGPEGQRVRIGLQLQGLVLKSFCHPHPYIKGVTEANAAAVASRLEQLREVLGLGAGHKISRGQDRGFRSFTVVRDGTTKTTTWATTIQKWLNVLAAAEWQ